MIINRADLPFIAARLREAANAIDKHGLTAWTTRDDWQRGASTASYDPEAGGNRWELDDTDGTVWPVPSDSVGDQAVQDILNPEDTDRALSDYRTHLERSLAMADAVITDIVTSTPAKPRQVLDTDRLAAQVGAEGWCSSCYRNGGKLEAQAMHPSGEVKYRGSCRWCHEFTQTYGRKPPLSLLQKRHAGRRISETDILKALGIEKKKAS